jgi:DMSO/TMAO reductase YedYZ heme-binding membrane subunit
MISLPLAIVFIVLAFNFKKYIRTHNILLYVIAIILSSLAFVFQLFPPFIPIIKGAIGVSLFYVVMLAGAFKSKSKLRTSLFSVRKEYSILGFIFISPHALNYIVKFLNNDISLPIYGVITFIIMVPLFITSFSIIRKRFHYKTWKNLQRFAYASYLLLFIHLIVQSESPNKIVYIVMFAIYAVLKLMYVYNYKKKKVDQK